MTRAELLLEQNAWQTLLESRGWQLLRRRAGQAIDAGRDRLESDTPGTLEHARLQGRLAALREMAAWPEERLVEVNRELAG